MRVAYDISPALAQGAGVGRYTRELALALARLAAQEPFDLALYHNRQPVERLPAALAGLPRSMAPLGNKQWRLWLLAGLPLPPAWSATIRHSDVVHGADVIVPATAQPAVITVMDLTPIRLGEMHAPLNRHYLRRALPVMAKRARAIIAISASTRQDVIDYLHVPPAKVTTIYPGVDHARFQPRPAAESAARLAAIGIRPPYLLSVGTDEPRKNLARLLEAYARLGSETPPLVLTGAPGWGNTALAQRAGVLGIADRVHFTGYVADELLPVLFAAAELFVYPSLFEGFGLPVAEAMACGTPVVTADNSSLPEVAGEAARLVDATDEEALAEAMRAVLAAPEMRAEIRRKGLAQAARFTWEGAARATLAVYRQCRGGNR